MSSCRCRAAVALALGLTPPVQKHQRDQEQHDRRCGGDERELEEEPTAGVREEHGARPVDHDRPAGIEDVVYAMA